MGKVVNYGLSIGFLLFLPEGGMIITYKSCCHYHPCLKGTESMKT